MRAIEDLLAQARALGVELIAEGKHLRYRAPVGRLGDELRSELCARKGEVIEFLHKSMGSPWLIPLRMPRGARHAVGFLPGILGTGLYYHALEAHLPDHVDAFTCRLPGSDGAETALESVESMAVHCARQLRLSGHRGDWSLVGWSFGGILALETARHMSALGSVVRQVALIDSYEMSPVLRSRFGDDAVLQEEFAALLRRSAALHGPAAGQMQAPHCDLNHLLEVYRTHVRAWLAYVPQTADYEVIEIRAERTNARLDGGEHAPKPVRTRSRRVFVVPGDHDSIMGGVDSREVGGVLRSILPAIPPR